MKDKRRRLTDEQKQEIYRLHHESGYTKYRLAQLFDVSRTAIHYVCDPEKYQRCKDLHKERYQAKKDQV